MISNLRKIAAVLMGMLILLTLPVISALAEEAPAFSLPVEITVDGTFANLDETFVVRLTADDDNMPMPNGEKGGYYDIEIKGAGEGIFPKIEYKGVGIYTYKVEQLKGNNPRCKYDERVYILKVSITNRNSGGYDIMVTLHGEDDKPKPDAVVFQNTYKNTHKIEEQTLSQTPKPDTKPIKPVQTGVEDRYMLYFAGSAALILVAVGLIWAIRKNKENE